MQAGAGVKGEFENRLKSVIDEVRSSPQPIILFIDEAHTMIGAGGAMPNVVCAENLISQNERDEIVEAIKNKKMPLQNTKLGGEIYIHGNGSKTDWTLGCVALEDEEMKELFDAIPIGTSIKIEP